MRLTAGALESQEAIRDRLGMADTTECLTGGACAPGVFHILTGTPPTSLLREFSSGMRMEVVDFEDEFNLAPYPLLKKRAETPRGLLRIRALGSMDSG